VPFLLDVRTTDNKLNSFSASESTKWSPPIPEWGGGSVRMNMMKIGCGERGREAVNGERE